MFADLGEAHSHTQHRRTSVNDMSAGHHHDSGRNEIRLAGHLDSRWAAWFDGISLITEGDGITVIRGPVNDRAALNGLLQKLRELILVLVLVTQVDLDRGVDRPSTAHGATRGPVITTDPETRNRRVLPSVVGITPSRGRDESRPPRSGRQADSMRSPRSRRSPDPRFSTTPPRPSARRNRAISR
jgi:hypothetical protein